MAAFVIIAERAAHMDPHPNHAVDLRLLDRRDQAPAAALLGRAMRDNPTHIAVFGGSGQARERHLARFFSLLVGMVLERGRVIGAYEGSRLIGILGMFPPGTCQPTARDLARIVPALALHHSPLRLARIARWYGAWLANDPAIAHWHMGPLAVDPTYRRQGIARRMGEAALRHLATQPAPAYLETDTEDNVELYQRFGFRVTGEQTVLGIRNWFMQRDA